MFGFPVVWRLVRTKSLLFLWVAIIYVSCGVYEQVEQNKSSKCTTKTSIVCSRFCFHSQANSDILHEKLVDIFQMVRLLFLDQTMVPVDFSTFVEVVS